MKFYFITILCFLASQVSYSQINKGETLNINDENGFVNSDAQGLFHYLFSIKSKDSLFERDSYKFIINNKAGFKKYTDLKEIGEKVSLDTLNYINIQDLAKFSNCELHNSLSLKKKIYVILKNSENSCYWRYPIIYTGTQKNIEMLKM